MSTHWHLAYSW